MLKGLILAICIFQSATACVDVACVFPNPAPRVIDVLGDEVFLYFIDRFEINQSSNFQIIPIFKLA
jgi:hypothetical protein